MSYHFLPDKEVSTKQEKLLFWGLPLLYRNRPIVERLKVETARQFRLRWDYAKLLTFYVCFQNHNFFS